MSDPHHLPSADLRVWLSEELAELVRLRGATVLLEAPLLEPSPRFFPDPWSPDLEGIRTLAWRLLAYAGLEKLDVSVVSFENTRTIEALDSSGNASRLRHQGAAAWFAGIENGTCKFGCEVGQLGDPEGLAGTLAHEVAHAYRHHHGLEEADGDLEERLTDLTTVYLGFGVLTTNASYRYRSGGGLDGLSTLTHWSHEQGGYLSPQEMSFLLAIQARARRMGFWARRRVAGLLETNQATYFRAALRHLSKSPDSLARLSAP